VLWSNPDLSRGTEGLQTRRWREGFEPSVPRRMNDPKAGEGMATKRGDVQ
jgi:hypothetical protein